MKKSMRFCSLLTILAPLISNDKSLLSNYLWDDKDFKFSKYETAEFNQDKIISEYISSQIKNFYLVISDLRLDIENNDYDYWQNITSLVEELLINNLKKNNTFLWNENVIIFDPNLFFISQIIKKDDYDVKNNIFKIYGSFLNFKIETFFKLKTSDFNDYDIAWYFLHQIAINRTIFFQIDDLEIEGKKLWKKHLLKKINQEPLIFINNNSITVKPNLLKITWIDLVNIKNNQISLGISYDKAMISTQISTKYELKDDWKKIEILKKIAKSFFEDKKNTFIEYHPFEINDDKIPQSFFSYINENFKYQDLKIEFNMKNFHLKTEKQTKYAQPTEKKEIINLFYNNDLITDFTISFSNYEENFNFKEIKKIINKNWKLDISKFEIPMTDAYQEMNKITKDLFFQIKDSQLLINNNYYKIEEIFSLRNFKIKELMILNKNNKNRKNISLKILIILNSESKEEINLDLESKKFKINEISEMWNDIFQTVFENNIDENKTDFLTCEKLSICDKKTDDWKTLSNQDYQIILQKWNKIIGDKMVITENSLDIVNNFFEIANVEANFYNVKNNDEDFVLNKYGLRIKKYMHQYPNNINGIFLTLKIKEQYTKLNKELENIKFNFILPVTIKDI